MRFDVLPPCRIRCGVVGTRAFFCSMLTCIAFGTIGKFKTHTQLHSLFESFINEFNNPNNDDYETSVSADEDFFETVPKAQQQNGVPKHDENQNGSNNHGTDVGLDIIINENSLKRNNVENEGKKKNGTDDDGLANENNNNAKNEQSENGNNERKEDKEDSIVVDAYNNKSGTEPQTEDHHHQRMNVVILYPDDWRHDSIGAENPIIQTPFLDGLANEEGMRFRQNAVTTSICWQSRATLFSGQWASKHRSYKLKCPHFANGTHWNNTWVSLLQKEGGYFVGHVGKWQYYSDNKDRFDWASYFEGDHWYNSKGGRDKPKNISGEDMARDEAIAFLNARPREKPFALTVAFYPPKPVGKGDTPGAQWMPKHETRALYDNTTIPSEPYNHTKAFKLLPKFLQTYGSAARARWRLRYRTPEHYQQAMKNIYALITQVDKACKEIVDELKKQDLYNKTMIIFTTDNGMFHGAHGLAGKWYPYQESIRVPLIVYDPRMPVDKKGTVDDSFTLNVDLAETILGAAGLDPHPSMQGRDIADLYLPKTKGGETALERKPWRDEFFYEFTLLEDESRIPSSNALVRKKWKLIDWYRYEQMQLFDIEKDPLEQNDVVDDPANAEIVSEMKKRLSHIRDGLKEPDIGCKGGDYSVEVPGERR